MKKVKRGNKGYYGSTSSEKLRKEKTSNEGNNERTKEV